MERFDFVRDVEWKFADTDGSLQVSGLIIEPGTFTAMDGKKRTFTPKVIDKIFQKIDQNMPFVLTHGSDTVIGFATKFAKTTDSKVFYSGYVFDHQDKVTKEGFDSVSGEFDLDISVNGEAQDGVLEKIAFVKYPAVRHAGVSRKKEVKLSMGEQEVDLGTVVLEVFDETVELGRPTFPEFVKEFRSRLKGKGLDTTQVNMAIGLARAMMSLPFPPAPNVEMQEKPTMQEFVNKMRGLLADAGFKPADVTKIVSVVSKMLKAPYPFPYPKAQGAVPDLEEFANVTAQLEAAKTKLDSFFQTQVGTLKNEVKELGLDPEKLTEGMEAEGAIALLSKIKENVALAAPVRTPVIVSGEGKGQKLVEECLSELGLTNLGLEFVMGGENK